MTKLQRCGLFGAIALLPFFALAEDRISFQALGEFQGQLMFDEPGSRGRDASWAQALALTLAAGESPTSTSGGAGQVKFDRLSIKKYADSASPAIISAMVNQERLQLLVDIESFTADPRTEPTFVRYELKNVQITSYSISGQAAASDQDSARMIEDITLNYEKIKSEY